MSDERLDAVDHRILTALDRDGEVDAEALAETLEVSQSTIYYRLEKYRERGIVRGQTVDIDRHSLGLDMTAVTEIETVYGPESRTVGEQLEALSGVRQVYAMLGESSFLLLSHVRDHDHLQRLVERIIEIEGVEDSTTHIVLRTFKEESRLLVNYDDADLEQIFDIE